MAIDVAFAGLMWICIPGHTACRVNKNTAYVLKVDGQPIYRTICGRKSTEQAELQLRFPANGETCSGYSTYLNCVNADDFCKCNKFPPGKLTLTIDTPAKRQYVDGGIQRSLLHIDMLDKRFGALRSDLLGSDAVVNQIYFPAGSISAGRPWPPPPAYKPRSWLRSTGGIDRVLPGALSDQLIVRYDQAKNLDIYDGKGQHLIHLPAVAVPKVTIGNYALYELKAQPDGDYENLEYLLWYYPFGSWEANLGQCPDLKSRDSPVLLRCNGKIQKTECSLIDKADTRFWPVALPIH
jgi:hypothetical protein